MCSCEQVQARLRRSRVLYGRLLTSPDGTEWIRGGLTRTVLKYYRERVTSTVPGTVPTIACWYRHSG